MEVRKIKNKNKLFSQIEERDGKDEDEINKGMKILLVMGCLGVKFGCQEPN